MAEKDDLAEVLGQVRRGAAVQLLRTGDVDDLALRLVDEFEADLLDDPSDLDEVEATLPQVSEPSLTSVVCDLADLADVARRIVSARGLVSSAEASTAERAFPAQGITLHPESIRSAAAEVLEARADVLEAEEALTDGAPTGEPSSSATGPAPVDGDAHAAEEASFVRFWEADDDDAPPAAAADADDARPWSLRRPVILLVIELVLGGLVFVAGGGPIGLALPAITLVWIAYLYWGRPVRAGGSPDRARSGSDDDGGDQETDGAADEVSSNLASMVAATDRAFGDATPAVGPGGSGSDDTLEWRASEPGTEEERVRLANLRRRSELAERRWRALMGPNVEVEDVDAELARRDPQLGSVADAVLDVSPTVRAARFHLRRLEARWNVAWWAMDRAPGPAEEAEQAIDGLRAEGRTGVDFRSGPALDPTTVVLVASAHDAEATTSELTERVATGGALRVLVVAPPEGTGDPVA